MHTWAGSALTGSVKHLTAPTCSGNKNIERPRTIYLAADTSVYPEAYRSCKEGNFTSKDPATHINRTGCNRYTCTLLSRGQNAE